MVDIEWGSEHAISFVTNVGLITSNGVHGHNIMAAEWTHQISYSPGLIAVSIGKAKTTEDNIKSAKFFGVSLASSDQNVLASIAGGNHGKEVDKIGALKELGFKFFRSKAHDTYLVSDSLVQFECKLINTVDAGDHTLFIGEVVEKYPVNKDKKPLTYHQLKFWSLGEQINKPDEESSKKIDEVIKNHKK